MASKDSFELPPELIDRGIIWQVAGFAILGVAATSALAIYSESDTLPLRFFEVATTKLNWAFVPTVAFIVDRSRKMFERKSEIRAAARRQVREQVQREERERIQSALQVPDGVIRQKSPKKLSVIRTAKIMKRRSSLSWRHQLEILCDGATNGQMFRSNAEIRESVRRKIYEIEIRESKRETKNRIRSALEAHGIVLSPETAENLRRH